MALLYYYGDIPVEDSEVKEKTVIGTLSKFTRKALSKDASFEFREGTVKSKSILSNKNLDIPDYSPIGINKPLFVEVLCAYTGDAPSKSLFGGKKDMMIVSGVKSYNTYEAAPKVINLIKKKVADNQYLRFGGFDPGSSVVYYSPALDVGTTFCSYNLVADTFNDEIFNHVSQLFSTAAGLPVFAPAAPFLLAGSVITNMIGNLGKAIFESDPFMEASEEFRLDTAGIPITLAKQRVICSDEDLSVFKEYKPGLIKDGVDNHKPSLVHRKNGKPYEGKAPYLLVNVDGKEKPELEGYTPKIATAAILEKYYGAADKTSQVADILESAMSLYNDFKYHEKAANLHEEMSDMNKNSNEYKNALKLYEAYNKNIKDERFKYKK